MKFDIKIIIIAVLTLVIFWLLLPRMSFADEMASPAPSPLTTTAVLPPAAQLPSGSILGKTVDEDCVQKYGAGWSRFTDTLCTKD